MSKRHADYLSGRLPRYLLLTVMLSSLATACTTARHAGVGPNAHDCARQGGTIHPVCPTQEPMCVIPYPDAGRPCRDGDDCAGDCLATTAANQGEPAVGECERSNAPCGCRAYIEDGRVADAICVD